VDARLLEVADDLRPVAGREQVGRGPEVEVELTADRVVERIRRGGVVGCLAGGRLAELLQRGRVLIDVARIRGDDLAEGRSRRVDVDLEDRVRGPVLLGLAVRVPGAPVDVL